MTEVANSKLILRTMEAFNEYLNESFPVGAKRTRSALVRRTYAVPRTDRASTDVHRLPCVVIEVVGKAQVMYRLRSKFGVLKVCYHAGDLEGYSGTYNIPVVGW